MWCAWQSLQREFKVWVVQFCDIFELFFDPKHKEHTWSVLIWYLHSIHIVQSHNLWLFCIMKSSSLVSESVLFCLVCGWLAPSSRRVGVAWLKGPLVPYHYGTHRLSNWLGPVWLGWPYQHSCQFHWNLQTFLPGTEDAYNPLGRIMNKCWWWKQQHTERAQLQNNPATH